METPIFHGYPWVSYPHPAGIHRKTPHDHISSPRLIAALDEVPLVFHLKVRALSGQGRPRRRTRIAETSKLGTARKAGDVPMKSGDFP